MHKLKVVPRVTVRGMRVPKSVGDVTVFSYLLYVEGVIFQFWILRQEVCWVLCIQGVIFQIWILRRFSALVDIPIGMCYSSVGTGVIFHFWILRREAQAPSPLSSQEEGPKMETLCVALKVGDEVSSLTKKQASASCWSWKASTLEVEEEEVRTRRGPFSYRTWAIHSGQVLFVWPWLSGSTLTTKESYQ